MDELPDEPGAGFNSKGIGLSIQKKILGKVSSKNAVKHFIDDSTSSVLDQMYAILKQFTNKDESKKMNKDEAKKILKYIIKIVVKIAIMFRNDQFNATELEYAAAFKKKFHSLIMTVISFYEVAFTYDQAYLQIGLEECRQILQSLIERHSKDKTKGRLDEVFKFFDNGAFMEAIFQEDSQYKEQMDSICDELRKMIEKGDL